MAVVATLKGLNINVAVSGAIETWTYIAGPAPRPRWRGRASTKRL